MNPSAYIDLNIICQSVYAHINNSLGGLTLASELEGWEELDLFQGRVDRIWVAEIR